MNTSDKAISLKQAGASSSLVSKLIGLVSSSYLVKLTIACMALIAVLSFASPYFFTFTNFKDILLGTAVIGIISFGMTMVLISDGIDLSVGSVVAFCSVILCVSLNAGFGLPMALALTFVGAITVGLFNGFFVSVLNINPFIITLGSMSLVRGIAYIIIGGQPKPFDSDIIRFVGSGSFLGVPIPIYVMLIVLVGLSFMMKYTQFGRNVYAIGNNQETARLSGINVIKTRILVYCIMGLLAGLAGILLAAQTYAGIPAAGNGYELDALTAVILGGTSLKGGEGRLAGTLLGTLIVALVLNGQNMLGVPYFYQLVSKGAIIIFAMTVAMKRN
ncbi:ABC transporter permease [Alginatibacterium sediminis]|uniref:ABC transporter permease n=1 Tax=Alginatibacterium sediminis TaxID=2164068 RepID=A0A420EB60_9ALTE|nr:ABC transporter permease [Alginatibacterium sediminis]RKF17927.1 ABC transporter permease [Alginatibacterium sediminis]